jgi:hypothetical protein
MSLYYPERSPKAMSKLCVGAYVRKPNDARGGPWRRKNSVTKVIDDTTMEMAFLARELGMTVP